MELKKAIVKWRKEVWTRDFEDSLFGPSAILSDASVKSDLLFGKIERLIDLESALSGYWAWFGRYGDEFLNLFKSLNIAPKQVRPPKPQATRVSKRAGEEVLGEERGGKDQTKR